MPSGVLDMPKKLSRRAAVARKRALGAKRKKEMQRALESAQLGQQINDPWAMQKGPFRLVGRWVPERLPDHADVIVLPDGFVRSQAEGDQLHYLPEPIRQQYLQERFEQERSALKEARKIHVDLGRMIGVQPPRKRRQIQNSSTIYTRTKRHPPLQYR